MSTRLDATDRAMLSAASDLLRLRRRAGYHSVAAAVLTSSGRTFLGLDLRSRKSPVCAEPCALSAAHSVGEFDVVRVAAVVLVAPVEDGRTGVISPCGQCRELLHYQAPGCTVLVQDGDDDVRRLPITELFRYSAVPERPYSRED